MVMVDFGWEIFFIAFQMFISYFGLLVIFLFLIFGRGIYDICKFFFFSYSFCCVAQVGILSRALLSRSSLLNLINEIDLSFFFLLLGFFCFIIGVKFAWSEIRGGKINPNFYVASFIGFSVFPWVIIFSIWVTRRF